MKAKKFRVGQKVQSIYDPTHVFILDKSQVPERVYHEKGSDRWWTKTELQRLGAPENPATSVRLNGKGKMRGMHPKCAEGVSGEVASKAVATVLRLPRRVCLECRTVFQPTRPWQRFHAEDCRRAYWKRSSHMARVQGQDSRSTVGAGFGIGPVMRRRVPA